VLGSEPVSQDESAGIRDDQWNRHNVPANTCFITKVTDFGIDTEFIDVNRCAAAVGERPSDLEV